MYFSIKKPNYMTSGEFARLIGVPVHVLRHWKDTGKLLPHDTSAGGGQNYYINDQLRKALELKLVYESNRKKWKESHFKE